MHQLVPPFILANLAGGQTRGAFPAVGLFVDISGFSSMADALMRQGQHGAEVLAHVMRSAFEPLIGSVFAQGGFIAGMAGDALTALFPLETADLTARRALATASAIQRHTRAHAQYATPYGAFAVSVKAGLAMGEAVWGIVTSEDARRAAYYFRGSAIDGCALAEHHARPGDIILAPDLFELVRGEAAGEPVDRYYRLTEVTGSPPEARRVSWPPADLELAGRFFPRDLVTQADSGQFRQVVCLFVRLPTVRTEAQLAVFMQTVFALLDRYGGLLSRLDFGDKGSNLLLFWGAPVAYENDVERALNFILDLQVLTSIPINAGVTYRIAHAGFVGSELAEDYTPNGRGVNLAARFMTAAPRGEIWLDEPTASRARARFEVGVAGEFTFKGFAGPQKVYTLLERKAEESELAYAGPLVGREAELQALNEFVQPVFAGQYPGLLVVWGEPGMGKSRLVLQFLRQLRQTAPADFVVVLAASDEILRQPLNPFTRWLKHYLAVSDGLAESRNKRNFNRKLDDLIGSASSRRLADELDRTRSFLGALVGLRWADSLYEQLDTQARYENTLIGLTTLLQIESRRQPVVLFLEDAHWLDVDSRAFVLRFMRALTAEAGTAYPIALLAASRREGTALELETFPVRQIDLSGLRQSGLAALVEAHLGEPGDGQLLDTLDRHTEGNPFFTEHILRYLQEQGRLARLGGAWQLKAAGPWLLPGDVRAVLVARLDRLPPDVGDVVQTAAVLGREFDRRLLAQMRAGDSDLARKIAGAEQGAIWAALSEIRYVFRHALVRDAAYQMQVHVRRQMLHTLAVAALESLYVDDMRPHYGEVAYHAEQAGLADQARRYLQLAGDAAREAFQNSQANDYYSRALTLTPRDDLATRYDLLSAREALYDLQAKREEQKLDLDALEALAQQLQDSGRQAQVAGRYAEWMAYTGDFETAARMADRAAGLAREAGAGEVAVQAFRSGAHAWLRHGDYAAALERGEAGLSLARQMGYRQGEAQLLNLAGLIYLAKKELEAAKSYFEQSLGLFRELGDWRGQAMPLNNLGTVAGYHADYAGAQGYFDQSLTIARAIGHRSGESLLLNNLGWIAGQQGNYGQARQHAEQQLLIAREIGDRFSETYGLINLSAHAGALGDYDTAVNSAQRSLQLARQTSDRDAEAWSLTSLGHARLASGGLADATEAYRGAQAIRMELGQPVLATELSAGLARTALAGGDLTSAGAHIDPILSHLEHGGTLDGTDDPLRVYFSCYLVLSATGDPRSAEMLRAAYEKLKARTDSLQDEAARRVYLEEIAHHRAILAAWQEFEAGPGLTPLINPSQLEDRLS